MARARGANAVMAAAFETTYGTAPVAGYKKLPFVSCALGDEQNLIASDLLGYGASRCRRAGTSSTTRATPSCRSIFATSAIG